MKQIGANKNLILNGLVEDIYSFNKFENFDIVLLDSMFHFTKKDKLKETELITRILSQIKKGAIVVICIQDSANKVDILNQTISFNKYIKKLKDTKFIYEFEDKESGHKSTSKYRMIVVKKNEG